MTDKKKKRTKKQDLELLQMHNKERRLSIVWPLLGNMMNVYRQTETQMNEIIRKGKESKGAQKVQLMAAKKRIEDKLIRLEEVIKEKDMEVRKLFKELYGVETKKETIK